MHLVGDIDSLLDTRPNARVLVLELLEEDASELISEMVSNHMPAGMGASSQILVLPIDVYSVHKTRLGIVDVVIVNNRYNMRRVDRDKKYVKILQYLNRQRIKPDIHRTQPEPPLGIDTTPQADTGWPCGESYVFDVRVKYQLVTAREYSEPCGAVNPTSAWYCRSCGRFRGFIYKD